MKRTCLLLLALAGCQCPCTSRLIDPAVTLDEIEWTAEEQAKDIAVRERRRTDDASFHLIRLSGVETPHRHDRHDLTVVVLDGLAEIHLGDRVILSGAGDVVEIPRGTPHWAERVGSKPAVAYAIYTPPFDGQDIVPHED
ncbi:MAG: cupin domain-containing protein [Planctomycetota bacterium]